MIFSHFSSTSRAAEVCKNSNDRFFKAVFGSHVIYWTIFVIWCTVNIESTIYFFLPWLLHRKRLPAAKLLKLKFHKYAETRILWIHHAVLDCFVSSEKVAKWLIDLKLSQKVLDQWLQVSSYYKMWTPFFSPSLFQKKLFIFHPTPNLWEWGW